MDTEKQAKIKKMVEGNVIYDVTPMVEFILRDDATIGKPFSDDNMENLYVVDENGEETVAEVYEWWLVSEWFAKSLLKFKEVVITTPQGDYIWGRTACGQLVSVDAVVEDIYDDYFAA